MSAASTDRDAPREGGKQERQIRSFFDQRSDMQGPQDEHHHDCQSHAQRHPRVLHEQMNELSNDLHNPPFPFTSPSRPAPGNASAERCMAAAAECSALPGPSRRSKATVTTLASNQTPTKAR